MTDTQQNNSPEHLRQIRQEIMAVLASSSADEIDRHMRTIEPIPAHEDVRAAASGLVMLRGRIGGDGAPFNLGEATVTRAAVRMDSGEVGFSYLLGRDHAKARLAAVCDALWQSENCRDAIERHVLAPIRVRLERERAQKREQAAATRVDFFTLVRGED
jgi:alpha-D-ribose 1-methylphosphonate 5-triphosphate synthase subunit PhnG